MKVYLTGATGFLGMNLIGRLLQENKEITALVRTKSSAMPPEVRQVVGDVTNPDTLDFSGSEIVIHLAGVVGYSKAQRGAMEKVNVFGTRNVVAATRKHNIQRLIHMSSVVSIGAAFKPETLNEKSDYNISHLNLGYFETKRKAEQIVIDEVRKGKINAVVLNPATIYGPGDMRKGSRGAQLKVAQGRFPFYPPGGVNIVDVDNVTDAIVSSIENGRNGERYILGGENILIKDLFNIIARVSDTPAPKIPLTATVLHTLGRVGDVLERFGKKGPVNSETAWTSTLYHWFESDKAQKELGLKVTPAEDSIRKSISWAKQYGMI